MLRRLWLHQRPRSESNALLPSHASGHPCRPHQFQHAASLQNRQYTFKQHRIQAEDSLCFHSLKMGRLASSSPSSPSFILVMACKPTGGKGRLITEFISVRVLLLVWIYHWELTEESGEQKPAPLLVFSLSLESTVSLLPLTRAVRKALAGSRISHSAFALASLLGLESRYKKKAIGSGEEAGGKHDQT